LELIRNTPHLEKFKSEVEKIDHAVQHPDEAQNADLVYAERIVHLEAIIADKKNSLQEMIKAHEELNEIMEKKHERFICAGFTRASCIISP
jgi:hypothetical protein